MFERLFGVQVGGLWAMVQGLGIALVIVAIGFVLSKIELPDRGASHNKGKGDK